MIEEPPGPPLPLQAHAPRECGWFVSSTELREGLEVRDLGDLGSGLPAASWPHAQFAQVSQVQPSLEAA